MRNPCKPHLPPSLGNPQSCPINPSSTTCSNEKKHTTSQKHPPIQGRINDGRNLIDLVRQRHGDTHDSDYLPLKRNKTHRTLKIQKEREVYKGREVYPSVELLTSYKKKKKTSLDTEKQLVSGYQDTFKRTSNQASVWK